MWCSFFDYILGTFLGTIPGSFTYNLLGSSIGEPINYWKASWIVIFVIIIAFFTWLVKKKTEKKD